MLSVKDWDLVSEINVASDSLLHIEPVPEPSATSREAAPLQWGAGAEATAGTVDDDHFDSLLGFLSTAPSAEPTPRMQRGAGAALWRLNRIPWAMGVFSNFNAVPGLGRSRAILGRPSNFVKYSIRTHDGW